jgi:hypothetical protein
LISSTPQIASSVASETRVETFRHILLIVENATPQRRPRASKGAEHMIDDNPYSAFLPEVRSTVASPEDGLAGAPQIPETANFARNSRIPAATGFA